MTNQCVIKEYTYGAEHKELIIKSSLNSSEVTVELEGMIITVDGRNLIKAVQNCMNV